MEEQELIDKAEITPVPIAPVGIDLSKVNLTDVALAQFGKWREKTAEARKTLTGVQHDLSTQAKIDDAKSLRHRLINIPLAEARKVSKALKSKLNAVSSEVGTELTAIETDYASVALLITPQIDERESQLAKEKAEREEAEAARKKVHTDAIAKLAGYVGQAADLPAERIAGGIAYLESIDLSGMEEYTGEATETRGRTLAALRMLHVKAMTREGEEARLKAEREEQARVAAQQAEQARVLQEKQEALDRQRAELEAREAEERRQRAAAEAEVERQRVAAAAEAQRREEALRVAGAAGAVPDPEIRPAVPAVLQAHSLGVITAGGEARDEMRRLDALPAAGPAVIPMPTRAPAAPQATETGWQPAEAMPKEPADWIEVQTTSTYRFHPYKPNSQEVRRGIRGRWQMGNDYGGWDNCEQPEGPWRMAPAAGSKGEAA